MPTLALCPLASAPRPGKGAHFNLPDGIGVALFNLDGQFFALQNNCPHMDSPVQDGVIERGVLTCPWHGWQFDLRTGISLMSDHIRIPSYAVRIEAGQVTIEIP